MGELLFLISCAPLGFLIYDAYRQGDFTKGIKLVLLFVGLCITTAFLVKFFGLIFVFSVPIILFVVLIMMKK